MLRNMLVCQTLWPLEEENRKTILFINQSINQSITHSPKINVNINRKMIQKIWPGKAKTKSIAKLPPTRLQNEDSEILDQAGKVLAMGADNDALIVHLDAFGREAARAQRFQNAHEGFGWAGEADKRSDGGKERLEDLLRVGRRHTEQELK